MVTYKMFMVRNKIILDTVSTFISGEMDKFIDYSLDDGIETIYELLHAENSDNVRQFLKEVNTTRNNNNYLNHRIKFRKDTHINAIIENHLKNNRISDLYDTNCI